MVKRTECTKTPSQGVGKMVWKKPEAASQCGRLGSKWSRITPPPHARVVGKVASITSEVAGERKKPVSKSWGISLKVCINSKAEAASPSKTATSVSSPGHGASQSGHFDSNTRVVSCRTALPEGAFKVKDAFATITPAAHLATCASHVVFLRLNTHCQPSMAVKKLVYLDRHEITFGRNPNCNVVLDSSRAPCMISRMHGSLRRLLSDDGQEEWLLKDDKSMNGVIVKSNPIGTGGCTLKPGDVITFGRRMTPSEFEFVFEMTAMTTQKQSPFAREREVLNIHPKTISGFQNELEAERVRTLAQPVKNNFGVPIKHLHTELICCICQDWLVNSSAISCSHTFCGSCIESLLVRKKFGCPIRRQATNQEPFRNRVIDTIVQKAVDHLPINEKANYFSRKSAASRVLQKAERQFAELQRGVNEVLEEGKSFFHINSCWSLRDKLVFQRGVGNYAGDAQLIGLTVQWVPSAYETKSTQAQP